MIRVYIIAADTPDRLSFTLSRKANGRTQSVTALQEVVEVRDLANPERMRALAVEFHSHFKENAR